MGTWHEILDNVAVRQRVDFDVLGHVAVDAAQAGKSVSSVYVHGARAADAFAARAAERKGGVYLVLDLDEGVQRHGPALVEVDGVFLHARLLGGHLGVLD